MTSAMAWISLPGATLGALLAAGRLVRPSRLGASWPLALERKRFMEVVEPKKP